MFFTLLLNGMLYKKRIEQWYTKDNGVQISCLFVENIVPKLQFGILNKIMILNKIANCEKAINEFH